MAVVALVNVGQIKTMRDVLRIIKKFQERNEHEIPNVFGIQPIAITANKPQPHVVCRTPDYIRNRLDTARKEINRRPRSKGIGWGRVSAKRRSTRNDKK